MSKPGFLLLCGGKSSRMGVCKALLDIGGETLLDVAARAGAAYPERLFSVNDPAIPTPQRYQRIADVYPGCGPMAGIHAALRASQRPALITAPCDAPGYSAALADYLAEQYDARRGEGLDALLLQDENGKVHPLMGVYAQTCLPAFEESLAAGHFKLMRTLGDLHVKTLPLPPHISQRVFLNLNTPEDWRAFKDGL